MLGNIALSKSILAFLAKIIGTGKGVEFDVRVDIFVLIAPTILIKMTEMEFLNTAL